jgi:hypothetical protein
VGFGVVIEKQPSHYRKVRLKVLPIILGASVEKNLFSTELAAIMYISKILVRLRGFRITLITCNKAAALTLKSP